MMTQSRTLEQKEYNSENVKTSIQEGNTIFVPLPHLTLNEKLDEPESAELLHRLHRVINRDLLAWWQLHNKGIYAPYVSLHSDGSYMILNDSMVSYIDANIGRISSRYTVKKLQAICQEYQLQLTDVFPKLFDDTTEETEKKPKEHDQIKKVIDTTRQAIVDIFSDDASLTEGPITTTRLLKDGEKNTSSTILQTQRKIGAVKGFVYTMLKEIIPEQDIYDDEQKLTSKAKKIIVTTMQKVMSKLESYGAVDMGDVRKSLGRGVIKKPVFLQQDAESIEDDDIYRILERIVFRDSEKLPYKTTINDYNQLVRPDGHIDQNTGIEKLAQLIAQSKDDQKKTLLAKIIEQKQKYRTTQTAKALLKHMLIAHAYVQQKVDVESIQAVSSGLEERLEKGKDEVINDVRAKDPISIALKALNRKDPHLASKEGIDGHVDAVGTRTILAVDEKTPKQDRLSILKQSMVERCVKLYKNPPHVEQDGKKYTIRPKTIRVDLKLDHDDFVGQEYANKDKKARKNFFIQQIINAVKEKLGENAEYNIRNRDETKKQNGGIGIDTDDVQDDTKDLCEYFDDGIQTGKNGSYKDAKLVIDYDLVDQNRSRKEFLDKKKGGIEMQWYFSDHTNEVGLANHHLLDAMKFIHAAIRSESYIGLHFIQEVGKQAIAGFFREIESLQKKYKTERDKTKKQYYQQQLELMKSYTTTYHQYRGGEEKKFDLLQIQEQENKNEREKAEQAILRDMIYSQIAQKKLYFARYGKNGDLPKRLPTPENDDGFWQVINGGVSLEAGMITHKLSVFLPQKQEQSQEQVTQSGRPCTHMPIAKIANSYRRAKYKKLWSLGPSNETDQVRKDTQKAVFYELKRVKNMAA